MDGMVPVAWSDAVYARREDVVLRDVAGEHLLVPVRQDVAELRAIFALNEAGLFIWGLLDGERTLGAVLDAVLDHFEVDRQQAQADLQAFVERISGVGVVEPSH